MIEYEHLCYNENCKHFFVLEYSIKQDPPKICPKCGEESVKRLISGPTAGRVELSGQELVDKVKSDAAQLKKDAAKNEKLYANLLSESKYEQIQRTIDRQKKEKY